MTGPVSTPGGGGSPDRHDRGPAASRHTGSADASLRRWLVAGVVATFGIVLSFPLYLVKAGLHEPGEAALTGIATFMGREACVSCHDAAYQSWLGSHHDRAMDVANETTVRGDFDDTEFEHSGVTSRFYRQGGKYFVRTEGPGGAMGDFEVTHTFGWEPLQQYLVPFPGGRLQALPIAWDTEREEWFHLYPGQDIPADDWLHWTRNAQNWNGMCAECHSTNLVKGYDAASGTYSTTWSEIDVSCEACHGPGSEHVAWAELPEMARPQVADFGLVVRTSDVTNRESVELCAPCHSRRSELGDYDHTGGVLLDNVVPSPLREGLYHADGQILEEVYVYGSFVQSRMFRNDVRCEDCHDAHSLQLRFPGNELCGQCHRADVYDRYDHHFHQASIDGEPSEAVLCVKCHMVEQPYMVVDWRADHSMRVPRPDLSAEIGVPNACTQGGCHDDRPLSWALDAYQRWYGQARKPHFGQIFAAARAGEPEARDGLIRIADDPLHPGIVRATALSLLTTYPGEQTTNAFNRALADEDALIRYTALSDVAAGSIERLVELLSPLLFDPVRAIRMEAANRLADAPPGSLRPYQVDALAEGLAEYREAMAAALDFSSAAHNLANLSSRLGDIREAERLYRIALDIDDLFVPAKVNLALLLNATGRNPEAERLLREALDAYPDRTDIAYNLGLLLAEMDRLDEGVDYLGRAARGRPDQARIHYNHGLALQALERQAEAEQALLRALRLEPQNADFLYALGSHYFQRDLLERAREMADRLLELHPGHAQGQQLKATIEESLRR